MRAPSTGLAIVLLFAGALSASVGAAEKVRVGGTGSAIGMLKQVGAGFTAASGIEIDVVPSLGSSGAIRALADGKLDIAVSARPLTAEESAAGLHDVAALRTAYVLATSHADPNGLKSADISKIFAADNPVWADGTSIRIILRPRSDTDTTLLGELFPGMKEAIEVARRRPEVPTAATDQDNAELAEGMRGSFVGTTMTQLKTEHRTLHVVALDGIEPTLANFASGAYPFAKNLYLVLPRTGAPEANRFVDFLRSPQGEKLLRDAETLPGVK